MCNSQRGFTLPIVSAIIGFITAIGSAIFPTFFHNAKQNDVPPVEVATSTAGSEASLGTNNAPSAPAQARVTNSSPTTTHITPAIVQTPTKGTVPSQPIPAPTPSCQVDTWSCDDWSACSPIGTRSGIQTRNCTKTFDCPVDNNPSPNTAQPCNPPVSVETPTPEISYANQHCPKIIKIEDSLGNTAAGDSLSATFKKSDVSSITVKIYATDPQGLPIYYSFHSGNLVENEDSTSSKPSSSDDSFTINVTTTHPGTNKVILYDIDNRDNFLCFGASDARGGFYYTMLP